MNSPATTGETAAIMILIGGGYLALRKYLNWRIPVSILLTVAVLSQIVHAIAPDRYPGALFMLFSGGLMLGAWYMATDMVTSPTTNGGCWLYGLGIGTLVVVIRLWGGYPEGVSFSILLMNSCVPLIDKWTKPRKFGLRVHIQNVARGEPAIQRD